MQVLVIPAIDLREGQCVRLIQGRLEETTVFSDDPVATAQRWEELGAQLLHLVDLDGAFVGAPQNLEVVSEIVKQLRIPVQLGGGIRTLANIRQILDLGVERVILGTAAIADPELVQKACALYGERIAVGIDSKDGFVAVEGWEATVGKTFVELGLEMKSLGVKRIIFTDTRRDGTMRGPNKESTRLIAQKTGLKVIASGGVAGLEDLLSLKELAEYGVEGVIVGKALYMGKVKLDEAISLLSS